MQSVLVDSCIWIEFFNMADSPEKRRVDSLLDADAVATCGVVLAELVHGVREDSDVGVLLGHFEPLRYLEVTRRVWVSAGRTLMALRRRGIAIPLSDVLVGELCKEQDCQVYTLDAHFHQIPGLTLYGW